MPALLEHGLDLSAEQISRVEVLKRVGEVGAASVCASLVSHFLTHPWLPCAVGR